MQKGRILLIIFFSFFTYLLIASILFLIYQASASPKKNSAQKIAQITSIEVGQKPKSIIYQEKNPNSVIIISSITITAVPTSTSIPGPGPKPTQTSFQNIQSNSNSPTDYILERVNEYRSSQGLSRASANSETCGFAQTRAWEISSLSTFNHDGFNSRINNKTMPYPGYHEVTENIAYNTDYRDVVNRWIASNGHEENLRKDTPFVCIGKYGDYYAYQGWRP